MSRINTSAAQFAVRLSLMADRRPRLKLSVVSGIARKSTRIRFSVHTTPIGNSRTRSASCSVRGAAKAIAKLEDVGTHEEGKELERYVGVKLEPDEATQIQPLVDALVHALKEDAVAKATVHARVGLDVEAGGNALIRDIQGAREIVAKVKAGQDVTIEGFRLDTGRDPGK